MTRSIESLSAVLAEVEIAEARDPSSLTAAERTLFAALANESRKDQWCAGRIAAKQALAALGARDLSILADERGAPRIEGQMGDRYSVSITHGRRWALALATTRADPFPHVGLDLIDPEDRPRLEKLRGRTLTETEIERASQHPQFLEIAWGTKEALAKATETGMFVFALSSVEVVRVTEGLDIETNLGGVSVFGERRDDGGLLVLAGVTEAARKSARARAGLT